MRDLTIPGIERYRVTHPTMGRGNGRGGAFVIPLVTDEYKLKGSKEGDELRVIAASGMGWDHVSVSLAHRAPSWEEMSFVHRVFFNEDEVAVQLHVPEREHINTHPNTLHLWRRHGFRQPLPPRVMI